MNVGVSRIPAQCLRVGKGHGASGPAAEGMHDNAERAAFACA